MLHEGLYVKVFGHWFDEMSTGALWGIAIGATILCLIVIVGIAFGQAYFLGVPTVPSIILSFVWTFVLVVIVIAVTGFDSFKGVGVEDLNQHLEKYGVEAVNDDPAIPSDDLRTGVSVVTTSGSDVTLKFQDVHGEDSFWLDGQKVDVRSYQVMSAETLKSEVLEKTVLVDPTVQMVSEKMTPSDAIKNGGVFVTGTVDGERVDATVTVDEFGHVMMVERRDGTSLMR